MSIENPFRDKQLICSECGRPVFIRTLSTNYKYQTKTGNNGQSLYQCSYTCYDHALLRVGKNTNLNRENRIKYIINSEKSMKAQGKTILHPIIK